MKKLVSRTADVVGLAILGAIAAPFVIVGICYLLSRDGEARG